MLKEQVRDRVGETCYFCGNTRVDHLSLSMAQIRKERYAVAQIARVLRHKSPRKRRAILELASVAVDEVDNG